MSLLGGEQSVLQRNLRHGGEHLAALWNRTHLRHDRMFSGGIQKAHQAKHKGTNLLLAPIHSKIQIVKNICKSSPSRFMPS